MTTWAIPLAEQSTALADALTRAIHVGQLDAREALAELRVAASIDNQKTTAEMPWNVRRSVAEALRAVATEMRAARPEGTENPVIGQLEGIAAGLDQSVAAYRANGSRV